MPNNILVMTNPLIDEDDENYTNYTIRTTKKLNGLIKSLRFYTKLDFQIKIDALRKAQENATSDQASILAELYSMLENYGINKYDRDKEADYYQKLIDDNNLVVDLDVLIPETLFKLYKTYPTPEAFMLRLVNRLEGCQDNSQITDSLELRILKRFILYGDYLHVIGYGGKTAIENYVKVSNKLETQPTVQEVTKSLDEGIFEVLGIRTPLFTDDQFSRLFDVERNKVNADQLKPSGRFGLIRIAYDLARCNFRESESSKLDMYMFAIVYEMSFHMGDDRDIENNLFNDIYVTNLGNDVPSIVNERGINFKNFGEIAMLYVLKTKQPPKEKLEMYAKIVEDVQRRQQRLQPVLPTSWTSGIGSIDLRIFQQTVIRLKNYLAKKFDCNLQRIGRSGNVYNISIMQAQAEQRTATRIHEELMGKLKTLTISHVTAVLDAILKGLISKKNQRRANQVYAENLAMLNVDDNKGTDDDSNEKKIPYFLSSINVIGGIGGYRNFANAGDDRNEIEKRKKDFLDNLKLIQQNVGSLTIITNLRAVIRKADVKINENLVEEIKNLNSDISFDYGILFPQDAMEELRDKVKPEDFTDFQRIIERINIILKNKNIFESDHVSRTKLLSLCYYFYNFSEKTMSGNLHRNFEEHYYDFKSTADAWLDAALYKKLDSKSFFDIVLIVSSYLFTTGGMVDNNDDE